MITGVGVYTWVDGRKYEGDWLNNKMHGYGVFIYHNGAIFIGEHKNDKK